VAVADPKKITEPAKTDAASGGPAPEATQAPPGGGPGGDLEAVQRAAGNQAANQAANQIAEPAAQPPEPSGVTGFVVSAVIELFTRQLTGSGPQQRIAAAAMRGFVFTLAKEVTVEGVKAGLKELATPRNMAEFALSYEAGMILGLVSPVTDLFGLAVLAEQLRNMAAGLGKAAWEHPQELMDEAGALADEFQKLLSDAAKEITAADLLQKAVEALPAAEKAAAAAGSRAAHSLILHLSGKEEQRERPVAPPAGPAARLEHWATETRQKLTNTQWSRMGYNVGYDVGAVVSNALLIYFSVGAGEVVAAIGARLGKLGGLLARAGNVVRQVGEAIAAVEALMAALVSKPVKWLGSLVNRFTALLGRLKGFLQKLLTFVEKGAAKAVSTTAEKAAAKAATTATAKAAAKPAPRPAAKPAAKPAPRPAARPAAMPATGPKPPAAKAAPKAAVSAEEKGAGKVAAGPKPPSAKPAPSPKPKPATGKQAVPKQPKARVATEQPKVRVATEQPKVRVATEEEEPAAVGILGSEPPAPLKKKPALTATAPPKPAVAPREPAPKPAPEPAAAPSKPAPEPAAVPPKVAAVSPERQPPPPPRRRPGPTVEKVWTEEGRHPRMEYPDPHRFGSAGGGHHHVIDQYGRPLMAEGWLSPTGAARHSDQKWLAEQMLGKHGGTEASHAIGRLYGGSGRIFNLAPLPRAVNQGEIKALENALAPEVAAGRRIYVQVYMDYAGRRAVPITVEYHVFVDHAGTPRKIFEMAIYAAH
jgi:DNA/RNA non-specific endonuclease